jgi:hypothetical protein
MEQTMDRIAVNASRVRRALAAAGLLAAAVILLPVARTSANPSLALFPSLSATNTEKP